MNTLIKKILFVVAFVLLTLVAPSMLLLLFVDASQNFAVFVITYGVIIFAILGYIVASVRNMEKKLEETMEEIKMQNAAIAYKLTNAGTEISTVPQQKVAEKVENETPVSNINVPLNPAEPLVLPTENKVPKAADDGFDDFK